MEQVSSKEEIVILDNNMVRAEDLFHGPVINSLANVENGQEIDSSSEKHDRSCITFCREIYGSYYSTY